jgi:hypothetical protein
VEKIPIKPLQTSKNKLKRDNSNHSSHSNNSNSNSNVNKPIPQHRFVNKINYINKLPPPQNLVDKSGNMKINNFCKLKKGSSYYSNDASSSLNQIQIQGQGQGQGVKNPFLPGQLKIKKIEYPEIKRSGSISR